MASGLTVLRKVLTDHPLVDRTLGAESDDVMSFDKEEPENPLSCGVYIQRKADKPIVLNYTYNEYKIVLEGTIVLEDQTNGVRIEAKAGDVVKIAKGTVVSFSSPDYGKAFYVAARRMREF